MPFVKLDCNILTSTVWAESLETRITWIYLLASADSNGVVRVTVPGIAMQCGISLDAVTAALERFAAPDPYSRTTAHEGRRIRIQREPEFAVHVLNYERNRKKDHTHAERQRRYREQLKLRRIGDGKSDGVTPARDGSDAARVTQAEADTTKRDASFAPDGAPLSRQSPRRTGYPEWFTSWWEAYRQRTGRGTEKRETYKAAQRLSAEEQGALVAVTQAWFVKRERLHQSGAFVPEAPDPVRFIRHRRWDDEFVMPTPEARHAPSPEDLEAMRLAREGLV